MEPLTGKINSFSYWRRESTTISRTGWFFDLFGYDNKTKFMFDMCLNFV